MWVFLENIFLSSIVNVSLKESKLHANLVNSSYPNVGGGQGGVTPSQYKV